MSEPVAVQAGATEAFDEVDRRLVLATQAGLPLDVRPFEVLGTRLGLTGAEVMSRFERLQRAGVVRRIAAVPNHYALGYRANAMSVWDLADDDVAEAGRALGALDFVSHCYRRPRHPPLWPYNLFAMVHGRSRVEVEDKVERIRALLAGCDRSSALLYSKRILKKSGLRLRRAANPGDA